MSKQKIQKAVQNKQVKTTADTYEMNFGDERNRLNLMHTFIYPHVLQSTHKQHTYKRVSKLFHSN